MGAALQRRVAGRGIVVSALSPGYVSPCGCIVRPNIPDQLSVYGVRCMQECFNREV